MPLFVCKELSNLPPISMNNFDVSSMIRNMEILQSQVKLIQEAQETSLSAQVNLCDALLQHKSESDAGQLVATPAES